MELILRSFYGWKVDLKCIYYHAGPGLVCEAGPESGVPQASLSVPVPSLPTGR